MKQSTNIKKKTLNKKNNPETIQIHENKTHKLFEYIENIRKSSKKSSKIISIVGSYGVGKTHFIKNSMEGKSLKWVDATKLNASVDEMGIKSSLSPSFMKGKIFKLSYFFEFEKLHLLKFKTWSLTWSIPFMGILLTWIASVLTISLTISTNVVHEPKYFLFLLVPVGVWFTFLSFIIAFLWVLKIHKRNSIIVIDNLDRITFDQFIEIVKHAESSKNIVVLVFSFENISERYREKFNFYLTNPLLIFEKYFTNVINLDTNLTSGNFSDFLFKKLKIDDFSDETQKDLIMFRDKLIEKRFTNIRVIEKVICKWEKHKAILEAFKISHYIFMCVDLLNEINPVLCEKIRKSRKFNLNKIPYFNDNEIADSFWNTKFSVCETDVCDENADETTLQINNEMKRDVWTKMVIELLFVDGNHLSQSLQDITIDIKDIYFDEELLIKVAGEYKENSLKSKIDWLKSFKSWKGNLFLCDLFIRKYAQFLSIRDLEFLFTWGHWSTNGFFIKLFNRMAIHGRITQLFRELNTVIDSYKNKSWIYALVGFVIEFLEEKQIYRPNKHLPNARYWSDFNELKRFVFTNEKHKELVGLIRELFEKMIDNCNLKIFIDENFSPIDSGINFIFLIANSKRKEEFKNLFENYEVSLKWFQYNPKDPTSLSLETLFLMTGSLGISALDYIADGQIHFAGKTFHTLGRDYNYSDLIKILEGN